MAQEYYIGNMDCASCAKEVEEGVSRLNGALNVRVDFATAKLIFDGDIPYETLKNRVEALGKTIQAPGDSAPEAPTYRPGVLGFWDYLLERSDTRLAVIGGGLTALTLLLSLLGLPFAFAGVLYTAAMLTAMYPIAKSGLNALAINRRFSINFLMTIAAIGAILLGEYLEAATVIFLFAVGEALEGFVTGRARDGLRALLALKPRHAVKLGEHGDHQVIPVELLQIGETILIKPGENIPMDGKILTGESAINQAPITGESVPVDKAVGDSVYAGCINGDGALTVRVTHRAEDNTLSRIILLVSEAQSTQAPSQRVIDRFADFYTPSVIALALVVAFVPPLFFGGAFVGENGWLYRALTMLVIACPCALVISTPVTVISAITAASRNGVLIKGGAYLEALARVDVVAFDKTGTLTRGKPSVSRYLSVDCPGATQCAACDDVLALASAVERHSAHPLAHAVVEAAEAHQLQGVYAAHDVRALSGRGVQGWVDDRLVTVGSHALFDADYPHTDDICKAVQEAESAGQTALMLHDGERVSGLITVVDTLRPDSTRTVAELNALGLETIMLTGDNATVAERIAQQANVADFRANLLPEHKAEAIQMLQADGKHVAMVGDGVNDAPALATAHVGVAMGGAGSAQALETADVALMQDDIRKLPYAIQLARFARRLICMNIAVTFAVKAGFLVLAAFGATTMWLAIFADVGMSLIVTLNGMRPLRRQATD